MPTTVNGIGTRYCGRKDAATRPGVCEHCKASTTLETYTTRLWFSVFYIPIIPLKWVRVVDYCPACSRHWCTHPDQYEELRQSTVSQALQNHKENATVESALITHGQCLVFHMKEEADTFCTASLAQFPNNQELLHGLAANLDQMGRTKDATALYEKILALDPASPNARFRVAWSLMEEGKLDDAYRLLDFLRQPGASNSYQVEHLLTLASAYQKRGEHERTLELCAVCLREKPTVGENYVFRKLVSKSEQALGHASSLLPERSFSLSRLLSSDGSYAPWVRRTFWWSIAGLFFLTGAMGLNEYHRRHRTLYVLNAFAQPLEVSVDGGPVVEVFERKAIPIAEGQHQISISGPVTKHITVDIHSPYFSRWFSSPTWIVNVEGLSRAYVSKIFYAVNPNPPEVVGLNEEVNFVPHADFVFQTPPHSMKLKSNSAVITKIQVSTDPILPTNIAFQLLSMPDQTLGMTFAESHLEKNINDAMLLAIYAEHTKGPANQQRVASFLDSKLWAAPISIPLHRTYTSLASVVGHYELLREQYDARLHEDPSNFVLLYLRGRLTRERDERLSFYQKSHEAAPTSGWPIMAFGVDAANRGEWKEAKMWCDRVTDSVTTDPSFRNFRHVVSMAIGDTAKLEAEYRQSLSGNDLMEAITSVFRLADVLAAQGRNEDAHREYANFMRSVSPTTQIGGTSAYDLALDYVCGDTDSFLQKQSRISPDDCSEQLMHLLLVTGQPDAAIKLPGFEQKPNDWEDLLALSLSYSLTGNTTAADEWRAKACDKLRMEGDDASRAAAILEGTTPPTTKDLDGVFLRVTSTPVFLAALVQRFPNRQAEFKKRARKLNICRHPPYLLVKQVIEQP